MENQEQTQAIKDELIKEIKKRKKWEKGDFQLAHFFIWFSILASFSSSIIIAAGDIGINKIIVAIIAGIPGLVVVVDKTFEFARRSAWDTMYKIDMQELKDDVDFGKIDGYAAAKKLREITRRNESAYLKIGFFSQKSKGDEDNINQDFQNENGNEEDRNANQ